MYPADMNIEEREAYQDAIRASKESEWQRQQKSSFFRSNKIMGSTSEAGRGEQSVQLR